MSNLTAKEEVFAKEYVLGGCCDATAAWRKAHPDSKAKAVSQHNKASLMLKKVEVRVRIDELKRKSIDIAEEKFTVTVAWRLEMLKKIAEAGYDTYQDGNGKFRRENLSAARAAIQTMNEMLGVVDGKDTIRPSFNLTLRVEDASGSK
jgi:phage terminase small subunit